VAETDASPPGRFERDTAVVAQDGPEGGPPRRFGARVSTDWQAGRGPHGGYLAAIILRALALTVAEPERAPRSLTIHFARAPRPGAVQISTVVERAGRSLSTLSAQMEQDGKLIALALAAFSVRWSGPELSDIPMPAVAPPDPGREPSTVTQRGGPEFMRFVTLQPRFGGRPFSGADQPMELGGWIGLAEPRPLDALALAFFTDALIPAPFMRVTEPIAAPTIDLTIHLREPTPRTSDPAAHELVLARVRGGVLHDGFFDEDVVIWAGDGTVLAQSRQLAILMPLATG
jgi:acyl-CoA thioesterase